MRKGLVIVFTGDGKGKTTAAIGTALRALGRGMNVSIIQFIKGRSDTGESIFAKRLKPGMEFITAGIGFVSRSDKNINEHKEVAKNAFDMARQRINSGFWDLVILDEINNAVRLGLLDIGDVLDLIRKKPEKLHLILTGRDAHPSLVEAADMVTEMRSVKHPYERGQKAEAGIDY